MEGQGRGWTTGLHDPYTGALIAKRYEVVERIGQGGMGVVYRGRDKQTGYRVAIKFMHEHLVSDPTLAERFLQEVRAASQVEHPNAARILDWGRVSENGVLFIISEYLAGKTLDKAIGNPPEPMSLTRVRHIGLQILSVLAVAHKKGVIHRDLKPENIFLVQQGLTDDFVKVIDFGIAKILTNGGGRRLRLTRQGEVFGTPLYMSPEQCLGNKPVGPWSDLYAVGVMLYEMLTGRPVFTEFDEEGNELSMASIMTLHVSGTVTKPSQFNPQIPEALDQVVLRALRKNPAERFRSAAEFAQSLAAAIPHAEEDGQRFSIASLEQEADDQTNPMEEAPTSLSHDSLSDSASSSEIMAEHSAGQTPPPDVATAPTVTPTRLSRQEQRVMKVAAQMSATTPPSTEEVQAPAETEPAPKPAVEEAPSNEEVAEEITKWFEVWTGEIPKSIQVSILAVFTLGVLAVLFILFLPRSKEPEHGNKSDVLAALAEPDAPPEADSREALVETRQSDVIIVQVPVLDAEAASPETAKSSPPEATTSATEPPARYHDLIAEGRNAMKQRKWRVAERKFREATTLWPDGPDAWEELGNVLLFQRGKIAEAKAAFQRCLSLLPSTAFLERARVEGRLQGLQ